MRPSEKVHLCCAICSGFGIAHLFEIGNQRGPGPAPSQPRLCLRTGSQNVETREHGKRAETTRAGDRATTSTLNLDQSVTLDGMIGSAITDCAVPPSAPRLPRAAPVSRMPAKLPGRAAT